MQKEIIFVVVLLIIIGQLPISNTATTSKSAPTQWNNGMSKYSKEKLRRELFPDFYSTPTSLTPSTIPSTPSTAPPVPIYRDMNELRAPSSNWVLNTVNIK